MRTKQTTSKVVATIFGIVFIIIMVIIAFYRREPSDFEYGVYKIVLALAAAGFASSIPGFLNIKINPALSAGLRASGAIAIFIIVYFFNPAQIVRTEDKINLPNSAVTKNALESSTGENIFEQTGEKIREEIIYFDNNPEQIRLPKMILLSDGSFTMGSNDFFPQEQPVHQVKISSFYISETEVTIGQWSLVMGDSAHIDVMSRFDRNNKTRGMPCSKLFLGNDYPILCTTWIDAVSFCNKLSLLKNLDPAYTITNYNASDVQWNTDANGFRLPSEAEWEYAAKCGLNTIYSGTNSQEELCKYANLGNEGYRDLFLQWDNPPEVLFCGCERDGYPFSAPVASFLPNKWGLYDMSGNAFEWVWDWFGRYEESNDPSPIGPPKGNDKVVRGGSWAPSAMEPCRARTTLRGNTDPSQVYDNCGFRIARNYKQ